MKLYLVKVGSPYSHDGDDIYGIFDDINEEFMDAVNIAKENIKDETNRTIIVEVYELNKCLISSNNKFVQENIETYVNDDKYNLPLISDLIDDYNYFFEK